MQQAFKEWRTWRNTDINIYFKRWKITCGGEFLKSEIEVVQNCDGSKIWSRKHNFGSVGDIVQFQVRKARIRYAEYFFIISKNIILKDQSIQQVTGWKGLSAVIVTWGESDIGEMQVFQGG